MNHPQTQFTPLLAVLGLLLAMCFCLAPTATAAALQQDHSDLFTSSASESPYQELSALPPKNRVWENFSSTPKTRSADEINSPELRWKTRLQWQKNASGLPFFLNADPIGFSGGSNWFAYADGNPISKNDPFGLCPGCSGWDQAGQFAKNFGQGLLTYTGNDLINDIQSITQPIGDRNPWIGNTIDAISYNFPLEALGPNPAMFFEGAGVLLGRSVQAAAASGGSRIASEVGLSAGEIARIQNAANRISKPINLVGSRANGTANAASDWDYVIEGMTNANKNAIKNSLPGAPIRADQVPRNIDFFTDPLRTDLPHMQFNPR